MILFGIEEVRRVASLLETVPPADVGRLKLGDIVVVGGPWLSRQVCWPARGGQSGGMDITG